MSSVEEVWGRVWCAWMIEALEVVADFRRVNSSGFDVLDGETEGE